MAVALLVAVLIAVLVGGLWLLDLGWSAMKLGDFIQVLEAGLNDLVLIGAAMCFLATVEARLKRRRALRAIHELRTMAHVIDMH